MMIFRSRKNLLTLVACVLIIIIISSAFFPVTDETNWIDAGRDFRTAIIELRPDKTYIPEVSHRLGVSVLWVSAFTYSLFNYLPDNLLVNAHRAVFLSISLLLFGVIVKSLKSFISTQSLILFIAYMFLNRFFPIIGRSTWLDQFLTLFGFLAILFWVRYLEERKRNYLILAGILNGFALLTKYAGWWYLPIIAGVSLVFSIRKKKSFKKLLLPLAFFMTISLLTFIALYPDFWVNPKQALLLRFDDRSALLKETSDISKYLLDLRLFDPVLISGIILLAFDWIKQKKDQLFFIGVAGFLYLLIYTMSFLGLIILGRINYPFLDGFYRYTFPAIPIFALYTFSRLKIYIKNKDLVFGITLFLFVREIIFSPFLLF